jgi:hypothetical protein
MTMRIHLFSVLLATGLASPSAFAQTTPTDLTTGLQNPIRLTATPRGDLLVAEGSLQPNQGRISIVNRTSGERRTLLEGLPSGREVQGGASGPTALAVRGERTLFIAMGGGDVERMTARPGFTVPNPDGASSPLFCSVLALRTFEPLDQVRNPLTLSASNRQTLADGAVAELSNASGDRAELEVLAQFRCHVPDPNVNYRFSNPFGMALGDGNNADLFVADASMNTLERIDLRTGRYQTVARYAPTPNNRPVGPPFVDAVPDAVVSYGDGFLVGFLSGFPFTPGAARVVFFDPRTRTSTPFINGLTSVVDLAVRERRNQPTEFYVLEFSTNQGVTPAAPGRLLRYTTPDPTVVATGLIAPSGMTIVGDNAYIVSLTGRIQRIPLQ